MLHFGAKPPFTFEKFLYLAAEFIRDEDITALRSISIDGAYPEVKVHPAIKGWRDFDTALRNELARIRSSRKKIDPAKYIRGSGYADTRISRIAMSAYRNPSPLEAERMLDQERWNALEELALGHHFDLDVLIIYGHKLLILEKRERVAVVDKGRLVKELLEKV